MSDRLTIIVVVVFMLCSPLLVGAFMVWFDSHLEKEARKVRFEALISAMDAGRDFAFQHDFSEPCPDCGSHWQGKSDTHWILEHRQDCLFEQAAVEQSRRFDLMAALDAEILAKEAAEEEMEYEAWIMAENEALDR